MPTSYVKGDLLADPSLSAYALGVTTTGAMDAGIARAFATRFPRLRDEHQALCRDKRFHLGDVHVFIDGTSTVYALALQEHWKSRAKLAALHRALDKVVALAAHAGITRVGLPRIGTGLGGLDWPRVKSVLTRAGESTAVELVVFEQFVRARGEATDATSVAPPFP